MEHYIESIEGSHIFRVDEENRKMEKQSVEILVHPSVARVAQTMQLKLDERIQRYPSEANGRDNWLGKRVDHLSIHLQKELAEFNKAVNDCLFESSVSDQDAMINLLKEGADVCNLVMMVQDKILSVHKAGFKRMKVSSDEGDEYIK
jgi:hypothetical protein